MSSFKRVVLSVQAVINLKNSILLRLQKTMINLLNNSPLKDKFEFIKERSSKTNLL